MVSVALAFLLSLVAAFADVLGGLITLLRHPTETQVLRFTALGVGFLLGAAFLDRLPDAMQGLPGTGPLYMVIGYLAMLVLQHLGGMPHGHGPQAAPMDSLQTGGPLLAGAAPTGGGASALSRRTTVVTFVSMVVHTFMDGVIVAGAISVNVAAGLLVFIAIVLHKIPEGFTMATVSLAAGESRKTAISTSFGLALSTVCGALVTLWFGALDGQFVHVIMAVATGTLIYIATTNLMPTVKQSGDKRAVYIVIAGAVLFYLSLTFVRAMGLS